MYPRYTAPSHTKCSRTSVRLFVILGILAISLAPLGSVDTLFTPKTAHAATDTFNTSDTWTAPNDVCSVTVDVWGAGGGGGKGQGGGAGGGGAFASSTITVTPGNSYTVTVGTSGSGATVTGAGTAGGDSWFGSTSTVMAKGGSAGPQTGTGAGGVAADSVGSVRYSGGTGAAGGTGGSPTGRGGGGGGGSAFTNANGGNGTAGGNTTAGSGGSGTGNGGNGGLGTTNAVAGSAPGGGGGGSGGNSSGGNGANGRVTITYTTDPGCGDVVEITSAYFTSAPAPASTSSISMTSVTATSSATTSMQYFFTATSSTCGANYGTGATNSSWQTSTTYTDTGLQANKCYGYTVTIRDAEGNYSATSTASTTYTHAAIPGAPTLASVGTSTLTLSNNANGNPTANPATLFTIYATSSDSTWNNRYVASDGTPSASPVWLTQAQLTTLTVTGLTPETLYSFASLARNENSIVTATSSVSATTTAFLDSVFATAPSPTGTSTIAMTATTVTSPNTPVEYYFTAVTGSCGANLGTGGTDSGWQSSTSYTDTGLQANQCYAYTVTARDALGIVGATSTASTTYTHAAIPGAPTLASVGTSTLTLTNNANGNPTANPATLFTIYATSSDSTWNNRYVASDGTPSASPVWLTQAQLTSLSVTSLTPETLYSFAALARNNNSIVTATSSVSATTTLADAGPGGDTFILTVNTELSAGATVTLPLRGETDVLIDWGNGSTTVVQNADQTTNVEYTYASEGQYTISISGSLTQFGNGRWGTYPNADRITAVTSFGNLGITSLDGAFRDATNLTSVPATVPSTVTDMRSTFRGATAFNGDLGSWDTSAVMGMEGMFYEASAFNQPIGSWDTSAVMDMKDMFFNASAFNQDISGWDTRVVTNMYGMLWGASAFNQPIGSWDTSSATDMRDMFLNATAFNRDLSGWCVGRIESAPTGFDSGASAWTLPRPEWGFCPTIITNDPTAVGTDSATLSGTLTNAGNSTTTLRGFIYSTSSDFSTGVSTTSESGSFGNGTYTRTLTDLDPTTTYYYRAFAITGATLRYARDILTFTTGVPTVRTDRPDTFTEDGFTLNATLIGTGGATITTRGFIYSTDPTFSTGVSTTSESGTFTSGTFSTALTDLGTTTTYYYRAYITTDTNDTTYGDTIAFNLSWMIIVVDTSVVSSNTVTLPLHGTTNVLIDWGDGSTTTATSSGNRSHTYASEGQYTISISGTLTQFGAGDSTYPNANKITAVTSFGNLGITSLSGAFYNATNLTSVPATVPSTVTNMSAMFTGATAFNDATIGSWDTGAVTNMHGLFYQASTFNQDISGWDTSAVTNMTGMFYQATAFNQPIGFWDTSAVTNMSEMFYATGFNQPIGSWDTSAVTSMYGTFQRASAFNQDISGWDTSAVTNMSWMFEGASAFNQDISGWDTSAVTDMSWMFRNAYAFNHDLSGWCVGRIGSAPGAFDSGASAWTLPRPVWGTCPLSAPTVTTNVPTSIGTTTLTLSGTITGTGNSTTTRRGFEYTTDATFTTGIATTSESGSFGNGTYTRSLTDLDPTTTYYYRAFVETEHGFAYGEVASRTTGEGSESPNFILEVDTTLSAGTTVTLPLRGPTNVLIDWGDGSTTTVTSSGNRSHTYASEGQYTITISGTLTQFGAGDSTYPNADKITAVTSFGAPGLTSLAGAFYNATNLTSVPATVPSTVTSMSHMFQGATAFNDATIGSWDTGAVMYMYGMFYQASTFNQPIGSWDTGAVTNMNYMFYQATAFNQPISGWDTSAVTNMTGMFYLATAFNADISGWDTSAVTSMYETFQRASAFNQDISGWDTSAVTNMSWMFEGASAFNQDISGWDTSAVTDMSWMFRNAYAFNADISGWDTSAVTTMYYTFEGATTFNQDISGWDTGAVTDMRYMFTGASNFNRDLSGWCVGLIGSAPDGFDSGATAWTLPDSRPVWGTCPLSAPTVITNVPTSIGTTTLILSGTITGTGNSTTTRRGFEYTTDATFTTGIATTSESGSFGNGTYTRTVSDLDPSTTYYYRAFLETEHGFAYGEVASSTTGEGSESPYITLSGTLYTDEGVTTYTAGGAVIALRVDGAGTYSTTTVSGSGAWYIDNVPVATSSVITLWVDNDPTFRAALVTIASSTNDITNLDLYQDHVIIRQEGSTGVTLDTLASYDSSDDADIRYTAATTTNELTVLDAQTLYIWNSTTFTNAASTTLTGSFSNNGTFDNNNGTLTLTGTSETLSGTLTGSSSLGKVSVAGSYTASNNASTSDLTIKSGGSFAAPASGLLTIAGDFTNAGTFTNNNSTVHLRGKGYDISAYTSGTSIALSVAGQETQPTAMLFNDDGTILYVLGSAGDDINAYPLPTPYDISSYTSGTSIALSVATEETFPTAMLFNDDGTILYVMGSTGDDINTYPLPTPYDISSYSGGTSIALSVAAEETVPTAMLFNNTGTILYVLGLSGQDINAYPLPTPYDISSYTTGTSIALSVAGQETSPTAMLFNDDGTILYVMGTTGDDINAYPLPTPYDISSYTTGTSIALSVAAEETVPRAMLFNDDGTILYVMGQVGADINAYPLPWASTVAGTAVGTSAFHDVVVDAGTTAIFATTASTSNLTISSDATLRAPVTTLAIAGDYVNNGTLDASSGTLELTGTGKTISGTLVATSSLYDVLVRGSYTASNNASTTDLTIASGASFTAPSVLSIARTYTNSGTFTNNNSTVHLAGSTPYDISSYTSGTSIALYVGGEETNPRDMLFNDDGTILYVMGTIGQDINAYPLPTPYDISSYTSGTSVALSVGGQEITPQAMLFNNDGTILYVMGTSGDDINAYPLPTPYDISSYTSGTSIALSVAGQETVPMAMLWNNDGTILYVLGYNGLDINAYPLPTPYDISSYTSGTSIALSVAGEETQPYAMLFNDDGTILYVMGWSGQDINVYPLPTPYDISSYTTGTSIALSVAAEETAPTAMLFNDDGTILYVMGTTGDDINAYPLAPATVAGTAVGASAFNDVVVGGSLTIFATTASTTDLTIESGATLRAPATTLDIGGSYTNNGVFDDNTGTVVLSGTSAQTIAGTMTGSSAFGDLTTTGAGEKTFTSVASTTNLSILTTATTTFQEALSVSGALSIPTPSATLLLAAGATTTVASTTITGTAGNEVKLHSTTPGTRFGFTITGDYNITYASIKDSSGSSTDGDILCTTGCIDGGNTTGWTFTEVEAGDTFTLSGILYEADGTTPYATSSTLTIAVATTTVSTYSTTTAATTGAFTFSITVGELATGTPLTIFADNNATLKAVTVTKTDGTQTVTNLDLYQDHVIIGNEATGTTTRASDLYAFDSSNDADVQFTASSTIGRLTVASGQTLYVASSSTFHLDLPTETHHFKTATSATVLASSSIAVSGDFTQNGAFQSPSAEAATWITRTSAADNNWNSVTYGNGLFVAVASWSGVSGDRVMTSPDGITWTIRTSIPNNAWTSVTYGNGLFVAVACGVNATVCNSTAGNRIMTSPNGVDWTTQTTPADNQWRGITYGNGLFVAVAQSGTGNRVMTSSNGINWATSTTPADNAWQSVTYGNGLFVAVACGVNATSCNDTSGNRIMTSPDGIEWTLRESAADDNQWSSITYGNGLFVAVSTTGIGNLSDLLHNRVMTSSDGITWTSRTSAEDHAWTSVTYSNGIFVAVACGVNRTSCNNNAGNRVMTSPDGITWTIRTSVANNQWRGITYGNGLFVAVSVSGTGNRVMTSSELSYLSLTGTTTQTLSGTMTGSSTLPHVTASGAGTKTFLDNASTSDFTIATTSGTVTAPDALTITGNVRNESTLMGGTTLYVSGLDNQRVSGGWEGEPDLVVTGAGKKIFTGPATTTNVTAIAGTDFIPTSLTILGDYTTQGTSSHAGAAWTARENAANNQWNSVTYGNGLFVAVASTGIGNRVMTSPDGITWTSRTTPVDNNWWSVTYGDGLFVAVALTGTGDRVMTSPDGITWTARTSAADNNWYGVTYGNGLFVAVGDGPGTGNRVMTSPDGINWTSRTTPADNNWLSVTYGNGLFVAVATTGTGDRVMTSPDGITWTIRASAADDAWRGIAYGNGRFVAVACGANRTSCGSTSGGGVMTSPDGINWTSRETSSNNGWTSVTYGDGLFVAVSYNGFDDRVITSPDGINWITQRVDVNNQWHSVTYGDGLFVAVSYTGTSKRVMAAPAISTLTFASSSPQTISGNLTGANTFGNVILTGPEHTFATSADFYNLTKVATTSATTTFEAGATFTVTGTWTFTGVSESTPHALRSTQDDSFWYVDPQGGRTVAYLDVKDSYNLTLPYINCETCIDSGGNVNWWPPRPFFASLANHQFYPNQATTTLDTLTVIEDAGVTTIFASHDMRIGIDTAVTDFRFDTSVTSLTFGGTAAGKVDGTVTYEDGGATLVINVTSDFLPSETLTIDGIQVGSFGSISSSTSRFTLTVGNSETGPIESNDLYTIRITGTFTLADHPQGQVPNQFPFLNTDTRPIFAFALTPAHEHATVTALTLNLSRLINVDEARVSNIRLYHDADDSRTVTGGDTIVATGTFAHTLTTGTVTFTLENDLSLTAATSYLVVADLQNVSYANTMNIDLKAEGITVIGQTSGARPVILGTVTRAGHSKGLTIEEDGSLDAGDATGPVAPVGIIRSGGSAGGGSSSPQAPTTPENLIGSESGFYAPTVTGTLASHNQWTGGANAFTANNTYATANTEGLQQSYSVFQIPIIPSGNTVGGITVKLEASVDTATGTISIALSSDSGSTFSDTRTSATLTNEDGVYVIGSRSDLWNRAWSPSNFTDDVFYLRVIAHPNGNIVRIDAIQVEVYHVTGGGGLGGGDAS
jgi:surface protein